MPLDELAVGERIVGVSQVRRTLCAKRLRKLFVAKDAEFSCVQALVEEATRQGLPVEWAESMKLLGRACAIVRGAAAAGIAERNK